MECKPLLVALALLASHCRATSDPTNFHEPDHFSDDKIPIDLFHIPLGIPDPANEVPGEPLNPSDYENAVHVSMEGPPNDQLGGDPIEMAGLFEGDIAGVNVQEMVKYAKATDKKTTKSSKTSKGSKGSKGSKDQNSLMKNAIIDPSLRWPEANIPYVISASFPLYDRSVIARAFMEYHNKTCLRFVPRTNQRDYIHIIKGSGCSSNVGRTGGAQPVSLGNGCVYVGIVIHELMHAAGFWHEQSRADRDNFITINWDNIVDSMAYNFQKYNLDRIQYLGAAYDTGSVMHYGAYAFAKNRYRPTIIAKKGNGELGQRKGFSPVDLMKLNRLYQCDAAGGGSGSIQSTTTAPVVSTELPGECEDSHKHCAIWSTMGECSKNSAWMNVNCRKSCKSCDIECGNFNVYCDQWATSGECSKNNEYMKIYCPQACSYCGAASSAGCVDENRYCSIWAERGQCQTNGEYMNLRCKRSCHQC